MVTVRFWDFVPCVWFSDLILTLLIDETSRKERALGYFVNEVLTSIHSTSITPAQFQNPKTIASYDPCFFLLLRFKRKENLLFKVTCGLSLQQSDAKIYSACIQIELLKCSFWKGFVAEAVVYFPQLAEIYVRAHVAMWIFQLLIYVRIEKIQTLKTSVTHRQMIYISKSQSWTKTRAL